MERLNTYEELKSLFALYKADKSIIDSLGAEPHEFSYQHVHFILIEIFNARPLSHDLDCLFNNMFSYCSSFKAIQFPDPNFIQCYAFELLGKSIKVTNNDYFPAMEIWDNNRQEGHTYSNLLGMFNALVKIVEESKNDEGIQV